MFAQMKITKHASIMSFVIIAMLHTGACGPILPEQGGNETATSAPTFTPVPPTVTQTPMPEFTPIPATVMPTQPPPPILTPDAIQVERWQEYQTELAKLVLSQAGDIYPYYEYALCEWDILGRSGREVYVWAACSGPGTLGEKPALIYLETNGSVRDVKVVFPGYSWDSSVQEMFPKDIQEKIHSYAASSPFSGRPFDMRSHLEYRQTHPEEPPLVVLSATSISTPTP